MSYKTSFQTYSSEFHKYKFASIHIWEAVTKHFYVSGFSSDLQKVSWTL